MSSSPCVLVVADPGRIAELSTALADPFRQGVVDVLVSTGGDDTIDLFESRHPRVVVITASLDIGDAGSLIEALRGMVDKGEVSIVLIGDDSGPVRNALDAIDMKPDRFVGRPLATNALRFAVQSGLDMVARALGEDPASSPDDDEVISSAAPSVARSVTGSIGSFGAHGSNGTNRANGRGETGDAPQRSRTPTPLRGSARPATEPGVTRDEAGRDSGPAVTRARTDLGTGVQTEGTGPVPVYVTRTPTDKGIGIVAPPTAVGSESGAVDEASAVPVEAASGRDSSSSFGAADDEEHAKRAALRARWAALADSIGEESYGDDDDDDDELTKEFDDGFPEMRASEEALPLPPPIEIQPRRKTSGTNPDFTPVPPIAPWRPGTTSEIRDEDVAPPQREPTLIINEAAPAVAPIPSLVSSSGTSPTLSGTSPSAGTAPGTAPSVVTAPGTSPAVGRVQTPTVQTNESASLDRGGVHDIDESVPRPRWSQPVLLAELIDRSRDSSRELLAHVTGGGPDDLGDLDELDDEIVAGSPAHTPLPHVLRGDRLQALEDLVEPEPPPEMPAPPPSRPSRPEIEERPGGGGRDFARQLRAKMSMMAQRLFQGDSPAQPAEHGPRHDHHTEIDLAALSEEPALEASVTEIARLDRGAPPESTTSPGSWDTQVKERGLPDSGEIVRGVSDAAPILARMFAQSFTGRVGFRRDDVEKVVYFDQGRPVFASSNEPGDRMGELLVREGKITASQYERCQIHVEQSGRRMGEILVDFGYLKRRELLPAVRRHVEDIIYSLFGWDRGHYHVTADPSASSERIRLSRHPASLIIEGIRRKLDRTALEKSIGPASTVIEVPDRERLGGIINTGDLAAEERAALAAFDGQADLAQVARTTSVDVADVLPLAWGLVVLGLATARRAEADAIEESTALVGETDLAIDRERVRARWQLVTDADYFALLGVRRDATAFEIRRAYQAARRDFAADCFPGDLRRELARELEDIASVLDEAFRVLRDDRLRQTYLANLIE